MKAAILEQPGVLKVKEIEIPTIKSDEVLLKVQVASICNATDNHIYHGDFDGYHDFYPQILGHEVAGEVVELGSDVKDIRLGEIIALYTPRGAFTEFTVVRPTDDLWVRVPESIPVRIRSLVEMFHGAYVSAVHPAQIKPHETVLIVGQGPLGLTATATAKLTAHKVLTVDVHDFRVRKSLEIGADVSYNRSVMTTEDIVAAVLKETDGKGADVVVMCISEDRSTERDAFDMAVKALKRKGRITGLFVDAKGIENNHRLNPRLLLRKEATFAHTLNEVYESQADELKAFQFAVDKVAEGKINFDAFVTHEIGFSELEYGLDLCVNHMNEAIKVVLYPNR
ncbi:zinc-dependent alcohol dehydrogenase [Paenibacillus roseipurpureus]|uniref:Zinc-binding dehydrogenase n=1 Tax=Paenibacillus roseopurpureus TaxID=2918901 RepID=A0AA96LN94_9BACL|nr:zinc-binding dehydrogenase [Paenibacillus sp. MBLB1832]WNR42853.1 zinc-binding dehydrogenase [Paenibacillus sp. MBLB1832]